MNTEKFSEAMNYLDNQYVTEALQYSQKASRKHSVRLAAGIAAACLCLLGGTGILVTHSLSPDVPNPEMVQLPNPVITVNSIEEMEQYLDFAVPVLDKEATSYSVFLINHYPSTGQIEYADGSTFRIQYGEGDISGIYGGTLTENKVIDGINVSFYQYEDTTYAVWEQNHFTFSYVFNNDGITDIQILIRQCSQAELF